VSDEQSLSVWRGSVAPGLNCARQWRAVGALLAIGLSAPAMAQLRIAAWNITNYAGGLTADIQAVVYGVYQGRSFAPDALMVQEVLSSSATSALVTILNSAPGSPGDWAAATFINGPDTDSAFFYRTSKLALLGEPTIVVPGGNLQGAPRNVMRYDVRPLGYGAASTTIAMYSVHMKAGSTSGDQSRRLAEAILIRDNAEALPAGWNFLVGGDFNIQSSSQAAYQELVGSQVNNAGQFFDPINTPGSWNNNSLFRLVHTQDPADATGGMDDRHDQLLLSGGLVDGAGMDYIGNPAMAYRSFVSPALGQPVDNQQWEDPNHSYRAWGNDGTSYNGTLTVTESSSNGVALSPPRENGMVGATIAQAIKNCASGLGHIPVFLDVRVPPEVVADTFVDFGTVNLGETAEQPLQVANAGDVALWGESGIASLSYTLAASEGFGAPAGPHSDSAGGGSNSHTIAMDTSTPGPKSGTITINSNSPDEPSRIVMLLGEVFAAPPPCMGDANDDGAVNFLDVLAVLAGWGSTGPAGDANHNGAVNFDDVVTALANWGAECP